MSAAGRRAGEAGPSFDDLVAASGLPRLDARALLEHAASRSREWLLAHGDEPADAQTAARFAGLAARRRLGEPLAYLVGTREFRGLTLRVGPAVLVPRPETERLVELALAAIAAVARPRVLDLGTGSGAIAVAIALARPDAEVVATDVDADALALARDNARRLGATGVAFVAGDWWSAPVGPAPFDAILSNPPYVAEGDPHLDDPQLRCEPRHALVSGPHGLDAIEAIVRGAGARLVPGGWLLLEHGHDQGPAVADLLLRHGFADVATHADDAGRDRVAAGRRPAPGA